MIDYFPLSDSAICIEFGNKIDENINLQVLSLAELLEQKPFMGYKESIAAYTTLTVLYDVYSVRKAYPKRIAFETVKKYLAELITNIQIQKKDTEKHMVKIPTFYDGEDLNYVADFCQLSTQEIINIHSSRLYRVYMMGFLPGFVYLGGMDNRIAVPRKASPRKKVLAGSVGIAGEQTGIYPIDSPGGWQLIGRTELKLFDISKSEPILLKAGDYVKFESI